MWLKKGRKRFSRVLMALVFVSNAVIFAVALFLHPLWAYMMVAALVAFDFFLYFSYVRYFKKERVRYPLVPPEGKSDIYFPRTDIPRPIYEDMRRMQEKSGNLQGWRR